MISTSQNKWFLEVIPCILIPEYGQSNAPYVVISEAVITLNLMCNHLSQILPEMRASQNLVKLKEMAQ